MTLVHVRCNLNLCTKPGTFMNFSFISLQIFPTVENPRPAPKNVAGISHQKRHCEMDTGSGGGIPRVTPAATSTPRGGEIPLIRSWRRVRPLRTPLRGQGTYCEIQDQAALDPIHALCFIRNTFSETTSQLCKIFL